MTIVSAETAIAIALAHQEIKRGENLLADVRKSIEERDARPFYADAKGDLIRDAFGRRRNSLELGVPSGENSHRLCDLSYDLAVPIIEAHIMNKRSEVKALSIKARTEIDQNASTPSDFRQPTLKNPAASDH